LVRMPSHGGTREVSLLSDLLTGRNLGVRQRGTDANNRRRDGGTQLEIAPLRFEFIIAVFALIAVLLARCCGFTISIASKSSSSWATASRLFEESSRTRSINQASPERPRRSAQRMLTSQANRRPKNQELGQMNNARRSEEVVRPISTLEPTNAVYW